ncbi:hypothetical protein ACFL3F_04130 [Planctomycetota bacterium]
MDINWNALGINPDRHCKLVEDLNAHNQSILNKLEQFSEIIDGSRLQEKERYHTVLRGHTELLRIITLYHDVGKVRDHFNHGEHSYNILQETRFLDTLTLCPSDQRLAGLVIRHHLLVGTLFIGELSLHMLSRLDQQLDGTIDKSCFYTLLVIFAVLDTWAYTNDPLYATGLLYNYDRMVQHYQRHGCNGLIHDHMAWRFCCFMGAWRGLDYLDHEAMSPFETRLGSAMSRYYNEEISDVRGWIGSRYQRLTNLNLHYAIWLLGNCCYEGMDQYRHHNPSKVQIHNGFFDLLEDMVSALENSTTDDLWQVQFQGYRQPHERAVQVFQSIRTPKTMQKVLDHKTIDVDKREIVYNFGWV